MNKSDILPTYTKVILGGWPALFKVITKYTKVKKQLIRTDLPIISLEQLEEIFSDKQNNFIQSAIAVKAGLLVSLIEIQNRLESLEEQKREAVALSEKFEKARSRKRDNNLAEDLEAVNECLIDIRESKKSLEQQENRLQKIEKEIDTLLNKQESEWDTFQESWSNELIQSLEKAGIKLTELEKSEIKRPKTAAELIERIKELGLKLPKNLPGIFS